MDGIQNKSNFISYNCQNIKSSVDDVRLLCQSADIVALQETWLFPHDLTYLGGIHGDFAYTGKSAVDTSAGIVRGRPHGGVALLWRKTMFQAVTVVNCVSARLVAIQITLGDRAIMVFSVYMPVDLSVNLSEFTDCLSEISAIIDSSDVEAVFMLGDFNAHPGESFATELLDFSTEQKWRCADIEKLGIGSGSYTYVSAAHGCRRWLDHCLVTQAAWDTTLSLMSPYCMMCLAPIICLLLLLVN